LDEYCLLPLGELAAYGPAGHTCAQCTAGYIQGHPAADGVGPDAAAGPRPRPERASARSRRLGKTACIRRTSPDATRHEDLCARDTPLGMT